MAKTCQFFYGLKGVEKVKITIYSTTTCPYCKMAKDYLSSLGFAFEEKLVDQDDIARDEMSKISNGFMGVPFIVVEKDSGEKMSVVGFDREKIKNALEIKNLA